MVVLLVNHLEILLKKTCRKSWEELPILADWNSLSTMISRHVFWFSMKFELSKGNDHLPAPIFQGLLPLVLREGADLFNFAICSGVPVFFTNFVRCWGWTCPLRIRRMKRLPAENWTHGVYNKQNWGFFGLEQEYCIYSNKQLSNPANQLIGTLCPYVLKKGCEQNWIDIKCNNCFQIWFHWASTWKRLQIWKISFRFYRCPSGSIPEEHSAWIENN